MSFQLTVVSIVTIRNTFSMIDGKHGKNEYT